MERLSTRAFERLKYTVTSKKVIGCEESVTVGDYQFDTKKILTHDVSLKSCNTASNFCLMRKVTVSLKFVNSLYNNCTYNFESNL